MPTKSVGKARINSSLMEQSIIGKYVVKSIYLHHFFQDLLIENKYFKCFICEAIIKSHYPTFPAH